MSRKEKNLSTGKNIESNRDLMTEYDLNDDDFFLMYEKPNQMKNHSSKDSRRKIEQYQEEKALKASLDEYYYHDD